MLPRLEAEQQLRLIEAISVPHMKPDAVRALMGRYRRRMQPEAKKKSAAAALLDAFRSRGLTVVEEPAPKRRRKRKDKPVER